jgi:hypothetical protein
MFTKIVFLRGNEWQGIKILLLMSILFISILTKIQKLFMIEWLIHDYINKIMFNKKQKLLTSWKIRKMNEELKRLKKEEIQRVIILGIFS